MTHGRDNIMVILSSPSGVGKTTLTKKIQQKYQTFKISVSHTTRKPRSNEVDGVDYHFVTKKKFEELIRENKFYEYAKIFENYYGTLKENVDSAILKNDLIFDIDWQGTKQLSKFKNLNLVNPLYIPRNHRIQAAIDASYQNKDTLFFDLIKVLKKPYQAYDGLDHYKNPPNPAHHRVTQ